MPAPARRVAFDLLCRIELEGLFSDDAVNSPPVARLESRDRHLTTELVMGTLRWQGRLDHVLSKACSRPWKKVDPQLRILLRMSLYQMWQMDRIPDHALVNDAVEMAKRSAGIGAGSLINGILRRLARERPWEQPGCDDAYAAWDRVSLSKWLWERWAARFGPARAQEYALSLNEIPRTAFRAFGTPAADPALDIEASALVPGAQVLRSGRWDACGGMIHAERIQDEASQLIPHLLGPITGRTIWDACAAPGGKSAILLENAGADGFVLSSDLSRPRASRIARTLSGTRGARSGIAIVDAAKLPPFRIQFDAVLADVPCSGLGTLRRNPEIKWRMKPDQPASFRPAQESILASVSSAVKPGGLLLYSTCSTEPEENEDVVSSFLEHNPEFRLVRPSHPAGVEAFLDGSGYLRTFPSTHLWDGFFAALLVRTTAL